MTSRPEALRPPGGPLLLGGVGPILLSGRQARLRARGGNGIDEVEALGRPILNSLVTSMPDAEVVVRSPAALQRQWRGPRGPVERTFVPPDLGGFVAEWTRGRGPERALRLAWSIPDAKRYRAAGGRLHAVLHGGAASLVMCVEPAPAWTVSASPRGLEVVVEVEWPAEDPIRLSAVAAPRGPASARRARLPLQRLAAQQVQAVSAIERRQTDGITVEAEADGLGTALAWATARLDAWLDASEGPGSARLDRRGALLLALGALSVGRFDALALTRAPALSSAVASWRGDEPAGSAATLADSLAAILATGRGTGGAIPLGSPAGRRSPYDPWLAAWHRFDQGDALGGAAELQRLVEHGRASGLAWGLPGVRADDPALTAVLPATLVFGVLGARADAAVGRLRLAPRLPESWGRVRVRNLRAGDSRVTVSYDRDRATHAFAIEQTSGAVPLNLVFEPTVRAQRIVEASVDGVPAELDRIVVGGRVGVRLQLPLDRTRRVSLVADA